MLTDSYNDIAKAYEFLAKKFLTNIRIKIATACKNSGARKVLDIGCGPGLQCLELIQQGMAATGVDSSPAMLVLARSNLSGHDVKLIEGSADKLPFANNFMDAVILSLILHENAPDAEKLLDEALEIAPKAFILEWRLPARNLDYLTYPLMHLIERSAGKEHYKAFKSYVRSGGIYRLCQGRNIIHEETLGGGLLVLLGVERG